MAGKNPITRIIITATDQASGVFSSLRDHAGKIAGAIAGYFGISMFGNAIGAAREFEAAMSRVAAASGSTGDELGALRAAAEQAGATTKFTSTEAAGALENLAKSGLSATQSVQALPAVLDLAQAGGVELATAAEFVTKAVSGMGLEFAEAGRVADVLAMGANASNTSVEGLANALSFAAPVAQSLGLSLEQTVAIIGKFADAGIDASRAGTALNSILSQFQDPASKFRRALADAGITTGDFDQALRQLAAAGPAGQQAILAVGQEAGPALRALLNQGIGALDGLKAKLDESAGSARSFAQVMDDNLNGAAEGLGSAWESVQIAFAKPLLEPLKEQITALADRLRAFVADGTVTRFGEAMRTAFESAAKWVQDFLGKVNFDTVSAKMREFADRASEAFRLFGEYASTAGGIAQTAFGVMHAGIATVTTAWHSLVRILYNVQEAVFRVADGFNRALASITFGDTSAAFDRLAAEAQVWAEKSAAAARHFADKSGESFAEIVRGAEIAQAGWQALTQRATESGTAATTALQAVEKQATLTADQLDAIGESAEFVAGAVRQAGEAATESGAKQQAAAAVAGESVKELRDRYHELWEAGDTTAAEAVWAKIQQALSKTAAQAGVTAAAVDAAFQRLGVTSVAALKQAADNAKRDFELIRDSGTAAPRDIEAAFRAYADKAIEANGGVADATLQAEAAQHGLRIAADQSGKAIVKSMREASAATDETGSSADEAATKFASIGAAADEAADSVRTLSRETEKAKKDSWKDSTWDENGNLKGEVDRSKRSAAGADPVKLAAALGIDVDPDEAGRMRELFGELYNRDITKVSARNTRDYYQKARAVEDTAIREAATRAAAERKAREQAGPLPTTPIADRNGVANPSGYQVTINFSGRRQTINTSTSGDADALVSLLQQLEEAASRA